MGIAVALRMFFLIGALLFGLEACAAGLNRLVAEKSRIGFVFRQMNVPVEGRFKKFSAEINLDPARPESAKVRIDIDLAGVDAGSTDADDTLKDKAWFHTAVFPKATFVASTIRPLGGGRFEARGPLTLKGIRRDIAMVFTLRDEAGGAWIEGGFSLPRLQFSVGEGEWADTDTVANEVAVRFKLFLLDAGK